MTNLRKRFPAPAQPHLWRRRLTIALVVAVVAAMGWRSYRDRRQIEGLRAFHAEVSSRAAACDRRARDCWNRYQVLERELSRCAVDAELRLEALKDQVTYVGHLEETVDRLQMACPDVEVGLWPEEQLRQEDGRKEERR